MSSGLTDRGPWKVETIQLPFIATRHNEGKIDYTLIPIVAQREEAKVWMAGEKKYGRDNWRKLWGEDTVRVAMASLLRHANDILLGNLIDAETGLPNAAAIRCNAAMILEYMEQQDGAKKSST